MSAPPFLLALSLQAANSIRRHLQILAAPLLPIALSTNFGCAKPNSVPSLASSNPAVPRTELPELPSDQRLSKEVQPKNYSLHLRIGEDSPNYSGRVEIDLNLRSPRSTVWLNARALHIKRAQWLSEGEWRELSIDFSALAKERIGLHSEQAFSGKRAKIRLEFEGSYGEDSGIFRQKVEGRWYYYSDFESVDARQAFPCFDDPAFKSQWTIELEVPQDQIAFSNMPSQRVEQGANGWHRFQFAPSSPLPSYLVAVATGPFDFISARASTTRLRIIAPKGQAELGRFVLNTTGQWLRYAEQYLGMQMPFPKLDFIAVPHFHGGMENPGLVTFRSSILLTGAKPSPEQERYTAGIVAHEIAHLWFGDSVSPEYWDALWLNEGFATWFSDKIIANWRPSEKENVLEIADQSLAFSIEHQDQGRFLSQAPKNNWETDNFFDAIAYRKGGAFLRMLEAWIGESAMQNSVRNYLRSNLIEPVTPQHLRTSLVETNPNLPVAKYFDSFSQTPGIPQLHVSLHCEGGSAELLLQQRKYRTLSVTANANQKIWSFPVCVRFPDAKGQSKRECHFLESESARWKISDEHCPAWLHPNDRDAGYYHYTMPETELFALHKASMSEREALGFAHSIAASFKAGEISLLSFQQQIAPLTQNFSIVVQEALAESFALIDRILASNNNLAQRRIAFHLWLKKHYRPQLAKLRFLPQDTDTSSQVELRIILIDILGNTANDQDIHRQALDSLLKELSRAQAPGYSPGYLMQTALLAAKIATPDELRPFSVPAWKDRVARAIVSYAVVGNTALPEFIEVLPIERLSPEYWLPLLGSNLRNSSHRLRVQKALLIKLDSAYENKQQSLANKIRQESAMQILAVESCSLQEARALHTKLFQGMPKPLSFDLQHRWRQSFHAAALCEKLAGHLWNQENTQ